MGPPVVSPPAKRHLTVVQRFETRVRGEGLLRSFERVESWLEARASRGLPAELDPFAQTGAVANALLAIACVSGIVLLFWYEASVHRAHASVLEMLRAPWVAGLVRSIHRYSSDGAMLFVLLHALRLFVARRFGGARWLAWVTGLAAVAVTWLVGWLGYWLVWDERAKLVALGSARMLDVLPIFADPLSRSFLAEGTLSSLLFFVVFFVHMLLPLVVGVALWLHLARLSRPAFFPKRLLTSCIVVSLLVVSLLAPADVGGAARMATQPGRLSLDTWYLWPLLLTERLSAGALWGLGLAASALVFSLPWLLSRGRPHAARVVEARCTACKKCYVDCPYDAIRMSSRSDGRAYESVAIVDPDKCVACGICAGSCDSAGIGLPHFDALEQRKELDELVDEALRGGVPPAVAFACEESAAHSRLLLGYHVVPVPCAGWVHPLLVERLLRRGARRVLVVACAQRACRFREGAKWTEERLAGRREPRLRSEKVDASDVRLLELSAGDEARLAHEARAFLETLSPSTQPRRGRRLLSSLLLAAAFAFGTWTLSRVAWTAPERSGELVVSFNHAAQAQDACRELTPEEKMKLPPHMRPPRICERKRPDVRLRISVDGRAVRDAAYPASGLWSDGSSIAVERIPLGDGPHRVVVELGDTGRASEFNRRSERTVQIQKRRQVVVSFERGAGFRWFE